MKALATLMIATSGLVLATAASAAEPKAADALIKANGCTACHTVDKKVVGPAFKEVAAKYRGQKDAEANLIKKVKAGGKGVWGDIPMPPNAQVKDQDIKTIVQWILSLK